MFQLRPFQQTLEDGLFASWLEGYVATIIVSPTGSGKTVLMSSTAKRVNEPTVAIAHRQELVQQISMAMARMGIPHNIIAAEKTVKVIISQHVAEFGKSFYDTRAWLTVAGVDTLIRQKDRLMQWANTVKVWMIDECHHCLDDNKWGQAIKMFPNARGVGFTASPVRCDRKSLARSQGGVFDKMVTGPSERDLIEQGYLANYRIFGPPQSFNRADIAISKATGDMSMPSMREVVGKSTITGDIVKHYLLVCAAAAYGCTLPDLRFEDERIYYPDGTSHATSEVPMKQGITFVVDVDNAVKTAELYRKAGVPAEAVSAKTPDAVRNEIISKFRRGIIKQLVNVDLFGEGFDVPNVEIVSMGRPTESFGLYLQQFGRALRIFKGKLFGIIIDHVGNVKRHGLPDANRVWSLENEGSGRRGQLSDPDVMPVTTCVSCFQAYEAVTKACPHCGHVAEPEARGEPKFVDGDLIEFSEELLATLRAEAAKIDSDFTPVPAHLRGTPAEGSLVRKHGEAKLAQADLRDSISQWAGVRRDKGMSDSEIYRRFFHTFKVDIATAQTLRPNEATELTEKVKARYWNV